MLKPEVNTEMKLKIKYGHIAVSCIVTLCILHLVGCGDSKTESFTASTVNSIKTMDESYNSGFYVGDSYTGDYDYVESISEDMYDSDGVHQYNDSEFEQMEREYSTVSQDMLVYHGNISITTKDFSKDLKYLKSILSSYDCFFENESKWTEKSYDDRNMNYYSAIVRVASSDYNSLLDGINEIGTVTNLSSSCENVSAEYTDTIVAIDIYEAERDRYVNMLRTITDDQYALEVQRELTDIELKLAQYRARKQNIETDVSYSYVTITLSEIREYVQQTEYNDNFFKRLWDTVVNTLFDFLNSLEEFLFFIIRILPNVILLWIVYVLLKKWGVIHKVKEMLIRCFSKNCNKHKNSLEQNNQQATEPDKTNNE